MTNFRQPVLSRIRAKARNKPALVILNWGAFAWYRSFPMNMTVGELRRQLAKELGRIFDGDVVGVELFSTGTQIAPDLSLSLQQLSYPPYRNVCLDVTAGPPRGNTTAVHSIGERLLRKHLCQERFQAGVDQRLWRLIQLRWPLAVFGISARIDDREVALRLNLEKYPTAPPLVEFWNVETDRALEPQHWPEPFIKLAASVYPEIAEFSPSPYCFNLLRISTAVATRQSKSKSHEWDVTQDLTQLLSRASGFFR
jgi:hypothetical protein